MALTTLNAAIELARLGYIFQVNALIRVVVECTTHLEFVVDPSRDAEHVERVKKYVTAYFADYDRDSSAPFQRLPIKQGTVNAMIGKTLDEIAAQFEDGRLQDRDHFLILSGPAHAVRVKIAGAIAVQVYAFCDAPRCQPQPLPKLRVAGDRSIADPNLQGALTVCVRSRQAVLKVAVLSGNVAERELLIGIIGNRCV